MRASSRQSAQAWSWLKSKERISGKAARIAAEKLEPISHRPSSDVLRHHVEGLMALLQETSGKPVLAGKTRDSVDDPHFKSGFSEIVPKFFQDCDSSITTIPARETSCLDARRKYAGKTHGVFRFLPRIWRECRCGRFIDPRRRAGLRAEFFSERAYLLSLKPSALRR